MIATFDPNEPTGRTILRPATGHAVTVNVRAGSNTRVVLILSPEDYRKVDRTSGKYQVTDLMTGMVHTLKPTDCGAGCRCAVTFA